MNTLNEAKHDMIITNSTNVDVVPCRARHQPEHRNADIEDHQHAHEQREAVEDAIGFFPALQRDLIH